MKKIILLGLGVCALLLGCDNVLLSPGSIAPSESRCMYTAPGVSSLLAERAAGFFGAPSLGGGRTIFADQLSARIAAHETFFIIDVRDSGSYGSGHIPGAVNIPLGVLFQKENLRKIPTDGTPIVTVCVTGHTGSMAMAGLGALGYNVYTPPVRHDGVERLDADEDLVGFPGAAECHRARRGDQHRGGARDSRMQSQEAPYPYRGYTPLLPHAPPGSSARRSRGEPVRSSPTSFPLDWQPVRSSSSSMSATRFPTATGTLSVP